MSEKIRVLIVDDLVETRQNVSKLLQFEPDIEVVDQAGNGQEAIDKTKKHKPDIVLMDIILIVLTTNVNLVIIAYMDVTCVILLLYVFLVNMGCI